MNVVQTDEWLDDRTWTGWLGNKFMYPTNSLRIRDVEDGIKSMDMGCECDIKAAERNFEKEKASFKRAVTKGASQKELERIAMLMSNIDGRKGKLLDQRNRYQSALQQIESIKGMTDQTIIMKSLSHICKSVNRSMPMHVTRRVEREYAKSMDQLQFTAESIEETFADHDDEAENKVADAATLVNKYRESLGLQMDEIRVPAAKPSASKGESSTHSCPADEELYARVDDLSK